MEQAGESDAAVGAVARPLDHLAVVLVEPNEPGNVGAIARSMWNFGARDLRLVVARPTRRAHLLNAEARARACHGVALLDGATCHDDLPSALAGLGRVFAFSARVGRFRQPRRDLGAAAASIAHDRAGRPALLFGREDHGLSTDEVELAHELVTIPVPGADPVMNLSHAATVALWEVARQTTLAPLPARAPARSASVEDRAALRADCAATLASFGLLPGAHGDLHGRIVRRFIDLFDRGGGEHADASLLRGFFVGFRRALARQETLAPLEAMARELPRDAGEPTGGPS